MIDPDRSGLPVSRSLFGFNHRYEFGGIGSYDPVGARVHPDLLAAMRRAGATLLRYPGGTVANTFHWKAAIGPQEQRGTQLNGLWNSPETSVYGPDEHARMCEEVGAVAQIMVNFANGTAEEAADWVEYMNAPLGTNPGGGTAWAEVRAANGHPEPYGVRWWEVGEEVQFLNQRYWIGALPLEEVAEKYMLGGTTRITREPLSLEHDRREAARLSTGQPSQHVVAWCPPIAPDSHEVYVDDAPWQPVPNLDVAAADDRVYVIDCATGHVTFGDGAHGAIPPKGAALTITYTSGPHEGFVDFYRAMKAVDPAIQICTGFEHETILPLLAEHPFDCVQVHPYSWRRPRETSSLIDTHHWAMSTADQRARYVAGWQRKVTAINPAAGVAVTEYGMFLGLDDPGPTWEYLRSLDQGLYVASQLADYAAIGVPVAEKHPLVNFSPDDPSHGRPIFPSMNQSPFGYHPTYVPQATALVTELFSHMLRGRTVGLDIADNPEIVGGYVGYSALKGIASIDEDGQLTIIVVNRDPEHDHTAQIDIGLDRFAGLAEIWTVDGTHLGAHNTPDDPHAVSLTKSELSLTATPDGFEHSFPAHSVTALRLDASLGKDGV